MGIMVYSLLWVMQDFISSTISATGGGLESVATTLEAEIITNTMFFFGGGSYYNHSIVYPKKLILTNKAPTLLSLCWP